MTMAFVYFALWLSVISASMASQKQFTISFPTENPKQKNSELNTMVKVPPAFKHKTCGFSYSLPARKVHSSDGETHYPYYLNATADKLKSNGFSINITEMDSDQIQAMTYTNGTVSGGLSFEYVTAVLPVGGRPALKIRAHAMALIGYQKSGAINWFCDGVLINKNWVLSAAHCLLNPSLLANVIRLGEYDRSTDMDHGRTQIPYYDQTLDYNIDEVVAHPEFILDERYHDLVLFKLDRAIPRYSYRIQPICLPWGDQQEQHGIDKSVVGFNVTLTGWGATSFNKLHEKTNILQEVDLEVFDTEVCDRAYNQLDSFNSLYPRGMTEQQILCVGSLEGGKDACQGDSGGPLVYQNELNLILVGIVSGGYGCGLKEYPGLYIPVHKPKYLQWIKEVAFKDYM